MNLHTNYHHEGNSSSNTMSTTNTFHILLSFFSTFIFIFQTIAKPTPTPTPTPTPKATPIPTNIHDRLPNYGFPKGIFPNNIALYTISPSGYFTVHLDSPCYVQFSDRLIYYNTLITGTITHGSISSVSGIQAKMLFIWLSVNGMEVDSRSGKLDFSIGALSEKLPVDQFRNVPGCSSKEGKRSGTAYFTDHTP